jgi:hypothetical protein
LIFRIRTTKKKPQCIDFSSFRQERERKRKSAPEKKSTHSAKLNLYEQEKKEKYQKSTKSCIKRKRKVLKKNKTCFTVAEF